MPITYACGVSSLARWGERAVTLCVAQLGAAPHGVVCVRHRRARQVLAPARAARRRPHARDGQDGHADRGALPLPPNGGVERGGVARGQAADGVSSRLHVCGQVVGEAAGSTERVVKLAASVESLSSHPVRCAGAESGREGPRGAERGREWPRVAEMQQRRRRGGTLVHPVAPERGCSAVSSGGGGG